jgi:VanZ family protein
MFEWVEKDKKLYSWLPTMVWGGMILVASVVPFNAGISMTTGWFDKLAHFFEYAVLAMLISRGIFRTTSLKASRNILFTLISAGVYGIVLELLQQFVPGRDASVYDVGANMAGVVFGIIVGKLILWQE